MIVATCLCGRRYKLEDGAAGKVVRCGGCGGMFSVPTETKPEAESLVTPEATSLLTGKPAKAKPAGKSTSQRLAATSHRKRRKRTGGDKGGTPVTPQQIILLVVLFAIAALVIWYGLS